MDRIGWRLLLVGAALGASACSGSSGGGSSGGGTPTLSLAAAPTSISNTGATSEVVFTAQAASGGAGTGAVTITPPASGSLLLPDGGSLPSSVTLDSNGSARLVYSCNIASDPTCTPGSQTIGGTWQGNTVTTRVQVTSPSTGATSGSSGTSGTNGSSGSSGGSGTTSSSQSCSNPANTLTVFSLVPATLSTAAGSPQALLTVLAQFPDGTNAVGCNVTFAELPGEHLVSLSVNVFPVTATGQAQVTIAAGQTQGTANILVGLVGAAPDAGSTSLDVAIPIQGSLPVPDGGPNLIGATITAGVPFPTSISTQGSCSAAFPCTALLTFTALDSTSAPIVGEPVKFVVGAQGAPVTLGGDGGALTTNANGSVTVAVTSETQSGDAQVIATLGNVASGTGIVPIIGAPTSIVYDTAIDGGTALLGIQGSGIQESTSMVWLVTDQLGNPVPNAIVAFTEANPKIVNIVETPLPTNSQGLVAVNLTSGPEVGVSSITATVVSTGAQASFPIAVRATRPSASNFYFRCNLTNLPVYTLTSQLETVTCNVALADRNGNAIGISVPVDFATEAGSIAASVLTQPFDPLNPTAPGVGTATVTFSTFMGVTGQPADVEPFTQDLNQFPIPRDAEPYYADGELVKNPRDQLVTVIAMTQGEEGFIDSNHDGKLDNGEVFFDLPAPYIDANDDNAWDRIYPGGPFEEFFCATVTDAGSSCDGFQGPNGVWDGDTTIWTSFRLVFTGGAHPTPVAANTIFGSIPSGGFPSFFGACGPPSSGPILDPAASEGVGLYIYDQWLNLPAIGTTVTVIGSSATTVSGTEVSGALEDSTGDSHFQYVQVLESDGGACETALAPDGGAANPSTGTACVTNIVFGTWDSDAITSLFATSSVSPSTCTAPQALFVGDCGSYAIGVTATVPNAGGSVTDTGDFFGQFWASAACQ